MQFLKLKSILQKVLQSFAIPQQSFFYARSISDPKSSHLMPVSTQKAVFFRRVVHHLPEILNILSWASTILLFSYRVLLKILYKWFLCDLQGYQMNRKLFLWELGRNGIGEVQRLIRFSRTSPKWEEREYYKCQGRISLLRNHSFHTFL